MREIADAFGALRDAVLASGAAGWRDEPETLLAAIIVLDQFSRNIHRGTARGVRGRSAGAANWTREAIDEGWDAGMTGRSGARSSTCR